MGVRQFEVHFWAIFSKKKGKWPQKRSFKSAKNRAAKNLWVGGHLYTRILCASKSLWEYNVLELRRFIRSYQNLRKSLLILKSLKKYLELRLLKSLLISIFYRNVINQKVVIVLNFYKKWISSLGDRGKKPPKMVTFSKPSEMPIDFKISKWVKFIGRRKTVPRVCPPNHILESFPSLLES